ncbi:odorant receptor 4-like [Leptopilina boulardi]|uniref:odorant receptor 4-like n=1 Tax=Leptopilina boulardi TaxID=63433 RepID=UPI0021F6181C|nr:odorant receptor 4-like [Leptopilina boulardi]
MLSEKEMKYNFDYAVHLNRWSMQLCGMWPIEDRFSKLRFFITLIIMLCITVPVMIKCFLLKNFFQEVEIIFICINLISTIIKVLFMGISKPKLVPLIQDMIGDWKYTQLLSKEAKSVMIINSKRARFFNALCIALLFAPFLLFITRPIILNWGGEFTKKSLPCQAYYPFDVEKSPNYELVYLWQILLIAYTAIAAMGINTFITLIVFHLCGQLQVVALNIKDIMNPRNVCHYRSMIHQECKCLHYIVERHLKLISDSKILENSFNIMFLMEVIITVISLCFVSFAVLVVSPAGDIYGTFINIAYFFAPTILIFLYNYIGENVIDRSLDIGDEVYNINWYDCNPKFIQSLMLIIIRSQKPLKLTAGKFFPLSLHAFKKILISALSYATVLLASSRRH